MGGIGLERTTITSLERVGFIDKNWIQSLMDHPESTLFLCIVHHELGSIIVFTNGKERRDIKMLDHVFSFLDNGNNDEQTEYDHQLGHDAGVHLSFQYITETTLQMIDRNLFFRIGVVGLHAG